MHEQKKADGTCQEAQYDQGGNNSRHDKFLIKKNDKNEPERIKSTKNYVMDKYETGIVWMRCEICSHDSAPHYSGKVFLKMQQQL